MGLTQSIASEHPLCGKGTKMINGKCEIDIDDASGFLCGRHTVPKDGKCEVEPKCANVRIEYKHKDEKLNWLTYGELDKCIHADNCDITPTGITISNVSHSKSIDSVS